MREAAQPRKVDQLLAVLERIAVAMEEANLRSAASDQQIAEHLQRVAASQQTVTDIIVEKRDEGRSAVSGRILTRFKPS